MRLVWVSLLLASKDRICLSSNLATSRLWHRLLASFSRHTLTKVDIWTCRWGSSWEAGCMSSCIQAGRSEVITSRKSSAYCSQSFRERQQWQPKAGVNPSKLPQQLTFWHMPHGAGRCLQHLLCQQCPGCKASVCSDASLEALW